MAGVADGLITGYQTWRENEAQRPRIDREGAIMSELGKVGAIAAAVVAIALILFSLMEGGIMGFLGFSIGLSLGVIAYDVFRGCEGLLGRDGIVRPPEIAVNERKAILIAFQNAMNEALKNTFILKSLVAVWLHKAILQELEAELE